VDHNGRMVGADASKMERARCNEKIRWKPC
jgi:hypothetical protein